MIRPAQASDAGELARIFVHAWRAGYRGVVADHIIDSLDIASWIARFALHLRDNTLATIVSQTATTVTGFARFGADPDRTAPDTGYLASLYVDPTCSGRGIGRALLESVVRSMLDVGRDDIELWVFTGNHRARDLYEKNGFRCTGRTTTDPQWGAEQVRYRLAPARIRNDRAGEKASRGPAATRPRRSGSPPAHR